MLLRSSYSLAVNLHFLIKLAGIFIRGQGYANGNVVYSRLTDFGNKFQQRKTEEKEASGVKLGLCRQVVVFNPFDGGVSGGGVLWKCQGSTATR